MSESMTDGKAATRQANRHHRLVDAVMAAGSMSIEDLAAYLNVSVMTVHRDLVELESQNVLRKTRGYATALPSSTVESNDAYRRTQQRAEKAELSAAALKFIQQGQSIMLDNSTTILPLLPQLESKAPLKVVSNSLSVINALTSAQHIEVVAAGGDYQAWCDGFVGGLTVDFFASVQVDILIASASAVVNGACYHQQENLVSIKRAMMKSAAAAASMTMTRMRAAKSPLVRPSRAAIATPKAKAIRSSKAASRWLSSPPSRCIRRGIVPPPR